MRIFIIILNIYKKIKINLKCLWQRMSLTLAQLVFASVSRIGNKSYAAVSRIRNRSGLKILMCDKEDNSSNFT